jgi:hypothetical protein
MSDLKFGMAQWGGLSRFLQRFASGIGREPLSFPLEHPE